LESDAPVWGTGSQELEPLGLGMNLFLELQVRVFALYRVAPRQPDGVEPRGRGLGGRTPVRAPKRMGTGISHTLQKRLAWLFALMTLVLIPVFAVCNSGE
jgi:hypothetical protein